MVCVIGLPKVCRFALFFLGTLFFLRLTNPPTNATSRNKTKQTKWLFHPLQGVELESGNASIQSHDGHALLKFDARPPLGQKRPKLNAQSLSEHCWIGYCSLLVCSSEPFHSPFLLGILPSFWSSETTRSGISWFS